MTVVSWRFLAPRPRTVDCWAAYAGAHAGFLMVPVDDDRVYCFAALSARPPAGRPDAEVLRAAFEGFADPVPEVVRHAAAGRPHFAAIEEVPRTQWGRGQCVLIGDAAHAVAPTMAQGAALAFEDALVLADLLASTTEWTGVAEHLAGRRRARVEWVRRHTSRQSRMLTLPYALRTVVLRAAGATLWRRSFAPLREPL